MQAYTEEQRKELEQRIASLKAITKYLSNHLAIMTRRCESAEVTIKEQDELLRQYQETICRLSREINDTAPAVLEVRDLQRCAAARDGECNHAQCPQLRDGEPENSGRHCPIDNWDEDD